MRTDRDDSPSPLEPEVMAELCALLARLCHGELSANNSSQLHRILHENSAARRYYLQYIALHCSLATTAGNPLGCSADAAQLAVERMTLERFAGRIGSTPWCELEPSQKSSHIRARAVVRWIASLSAVLVVAVAVLSWAVRQGARNDVLTAIATEESANVSENAATPQPLAAEVTHVSDAAVWRNPNLSYALASGVRSGQRLTLERGQVELTYSSGTKLLLTGPSDFVAQPKGGKLRRGELVARVPKAGHGFTIETPHGKVVDLGTEFGVVVDDFGVSQVSVFEGKVETLPTGAGGAAGDKIELTSGRAILWTDKSITPINVHGHRYQIPDQVSAISHFAPLPRTSLDDDFCGRSPAPERWKTLGEVLPTSNGLRFGGGGPRPFLITARQFDPSQGAITVVCDLRFENAYEAENASFAILTRSSEELSKPGAPWQEMLARSVRCRLMAELHSGEGMLEAGTKYEADRELSNISWSGFSRPKPNTLYRLEMRDDGLNVSFTVSQADNPLVRKTITCRSLFRGNQNFVAFEGSNTAPAIVERVAILQDLPVGDDHDRLAESAVDDFAASASQDDELAKRFDQLSPANGMLLLKDDFDGGGLNSAIWTTLGDVVLKDGQAQLGLPNNEQHIDTWHARPYLLTKRHIDPADGTIFVIGKVTFAENFLHGYGGSFAVMTRADSERGTGPGWENSILRRGLRANFWPAAFGFDHSLEIHEKPDPNTLLLLAAKGFKISPTSRTYLFRLEDDGRSATLTVIDAENPVVHRTLTVATTSLSSIPGHIGFESCWGSPVLIDSFRIFQAADASESRPDERE